MFPVIILGIVGNLISLAVWTRPKLRKGRMGKYMSLLAVADTCTLISGLTVRILPDVFSLDLHNDNVFSCYFHYYFLGFFSCISAWILIVMTVERFIVIAIPLTSSQCLSRCKAQTLMAIVVVLSALSNIPLILMNSWSAESNCSVNETWEDIIQLVTFTLYSPVPLLFILVLNIAIIAKMNKFTKKIEKDPHSQKSTAKSSRRGSLSSTNDSGIALASFHTSRNVRNSSLEYAHQNSTPTPTRPRKQKPMSSPDFRQGNNTNMPKSLQLSNQSLEDFSQPSELEAIAECPTPCDDEDVVSRELPDLVAVNLSQEEETTKCDTNFNTITGTNSITKTQVKTEANSSTLLSEGEDNSTQYLSVSSCYTESLLTDVTDCNSSIRGRTSTMLLPSEQRSQSRPDIIDAHISGSRAKFQINTRRSSHPPPSISSSRLLNHRLQNRRSSLGLVFDQLKVKSERLAKKYNNIRNKRTAIMLLTVTFSYFLLTSPYTITIYTLVYLSPKSPHDHENISQTQANIYVTQHVLEILLCLNHSINVLLYCATGSKFRREFRGMLPCLTRNPRRAETHSENPLPSCESTS